MNCNFYNNERNIFLSNISERIKNFSKLTDSKKLKFLFSSENEIVTLFSKYCYTLMTIMRKDQKQNTMNYSKY